MADPTFRAISAIATIPNSGGGAGTVSKPAGTVDGDYVLIYVINKANPSAGNAAPAGFTLLLSKANTTYQAGFRIYGKVAASEPASYSLTETSTANPSQAVAISFANPGAVPINASVVGSLQNSTTTPGVPALTTTATGKLIGLIVEYQGRTITLTAAGAMTSRVAVASADASFILADEDIATTGSISGRTASGSASGDYTSAAILLTSAVAAPVITGPTSSSTSTTVTGGFTTDAADGTARMVWTQSATAPSVAQIKAGQDHTGSTSGVLVPTALTITSTGAKSFAATAATTGLTYYGYVVHTNAASADSNVLSLGAVYPGTWRPASDVTVTGWTVTGAATHAAALNENSPGSDSEYVTSPALSGTPVSEIIDLSSSMPAGTYSVKVRAKVSSGSGFVRVTALNGSNVSQGATADQAITSTLTTYDLTFTTTGAATRYKIEVWN